MLLQLCESEEIFDAALQLFITKWRAHKSKLIDNFIDYFCREWTTRLKGWFEGYADGVPSKKNALESWNLIIKLESTMTQRHNIGAFLTIVENDIIGRWSRDRHPDNVNREIFYTDFKCDLQLYPAAFQWTSYIKKRKHLSLINIFVSRNCYFVTTKKINNFKKISGQLGRLDSKPVRSDGFAV
ncbi:hypothetical protein BpHYR1_006678 [Brachionus plicatilis]|uniref:Uncharacterized protein n=1 Tax=Brachionus plicatilis TaxID=10195 RepID=A0A3M7QPA5_BRAPC|nr:hypothetical protein BpHYR1_006678 [Brachionus plicatilis]